MIPEREALLDELARVFARAAVDALLEGGPSPADQDAVVDRRSRPALSPAPEGGA
jgi:hypothetical protein